MKKKVMLVDDDLALAEALGIMLVDEGYEVVKVVSGTIALSEIKKGKPDLVILDYMLPGKSGIEVLREVRNCPDKIGKTPVIMISASVNVRGQARDMGVNRFFAKPFDIEDLIDEIGRWVIP